MRLFRTVAWSAACSVGATAGILAQPASSSATSAAVPDTRPGRILSGWLDVFNAGDSARLAAYLRQYMPQEKVANHLDYRDRTGGVDLVRVLENEPRSMVFLLRHRNSDMRDWATLSVSAGARDTVTSFTIGPLPKGATEADLMIDAPTRHRVVDRIAAELAAHYVYPAVATQMGEAILSREKRGGYDGIRYGFAFADSLLADLRAVSHDKHLFIAFNPAGLPVESGPPSPEDQARYRVQVEALNCGFDRVERLPKNVGYVKFDFFPSPEVCGPTVVAAMNFLAHVDALIIDERENHGGSPEMVSFVLSYLFAVPTHVNDIWIRDSNATQQYWTLPYVPGPRLDKVPVFLLTSQQTFSGGEEFAYDLKNLKRAVLVGETTGGGAHPVSGRRIDDRFVLGVPFGRPINPVSKKDWEGVGVEPDVKVPAADALAKAQHLADDTVVAIRQAATTVAPPR